MKRLILSGTLLLLAVTSCTSAKAQWTVTNDYTVFAGPNPATKISDDPGGGFNAYYTTGSHLAHGGRSRAGVNVKSGYYTVVSENNTGQSSNWWKQFSWGGTTYPPNFTISHKFSLNGRLQVYCPSTGSGAAFATAKTKFSATPGTLASNGNNSLTATTTSHPPVRDITNALGPFNYTWQTTGATAVSLNVYVAVNSHAEANSSGIPAGTAAFADSGDAGTNRNNIYSTSYTFTY